MTRKPKPWAVHLTTALPNKRTGHTTLDRAHEYIRLALAGEHDITMVRIEHWTGERWELHEYIDPFNTSKEKP